jgi:hypothetical protein
MPASCALRADEKRKKEEEKDQMEGTYTALLRMTVALPIIA